MKAKEKKAPTGPSRGTPGKRKHDDKDKDQQKGSKRSRPKKG